MSIRSYSVIKYLDRKFLITEAPTESGLLSYISLLHKHNVELLVRVCEASYNQNLVESTGIRVIEFPIPDGGFPTPQIVKQWKKIIEDHTGPIAVHCVAGLGRAPIMVAIALIENGLSPIETIELIRRKHRGSFNSVQLNYLLDYKVKSQNECCMIQ